MTAPKKVGLPLSPFLNVPTAIPTTSLTPLGKTALASTQADRPCSFLSGAVLRSPHSASCQTTPACGPATCLNQSAKGSLGNSASRSKASICCTTANACFSKDANWIPLFIHIHSAIAIAAIFTPVLNFNSQCGRYYDCGLRNADWNDNSDQSRIIVNPQSAIRILKSAIKS